MRTPPRVLLPWLTPARAGALVALAWLVFAMTNMRHYGVTIDASALFYAGDRTFFWLTHRHVEGALDFAGAEPVLFQSAFARFPDFHDPMHYPVLTGFLAAVCDAIFDRQLGWLGALDAHQLALVLIQAGALFGFAIYGCRFLGRAAGIAATVALALFPCSIGHAFNNPKDWPCATFYALAVLATGAGIVKARTRDVVAGALFLGLSLSCKLNGVFVIPTLALWAPFALLLLYRRRRVIKPGLVGALLGGPYIAFGVFFVLWPWLYEGKTPADHWDHLQQYVGFLAHYGSGPRATWTAYPLRCLAYMTPPLVLVFAAFELLVGWRGRERFVQWLLLVLWTGLPLLRTAMPHSNFYDANRHFIEYVPGLCAMAGAGFALAVDFVFGLRGLSRVRIAVVAAACVASLGALIWPVVIYHPYEVTYFNSFIGGLGGAQEKRPFTMPPPHDFRATGTEGDYWYTSFRDALRRIYVSTPGRTNVSVSACDTTLTQPFVRVDWPSPNFPVASASRERADYLIVIPREGFCSPRDVPAIEKGRPLIARVAREDGIIFDLLGPAVK